MRVSSKSQLCLALLATTGLTACLPDSDSVKEKRLTDFKQTQAASYADTLSSFAVSSQGVLSASFASSTPPTPGLQGVSPDRRMAYGYCQDTSGGTTNHIALTWYTTSDAGTGNFSIKGVGEGAGAGIAEALSAKSSPESIGVMSDNRITLRGPREDGETQVSLSDLVGCSTLTIPNGSPVVFVENMQAPSLTLSESDTYEFKSEPCSDPSDIGTITFRKRLSEASWQEYDNTCNGAVSTRAVTINANNAARLVDGVDLQGAGNLQQTLNGLAANKACRESKHDKKPEAEYQPGIDGLPYENENDTREKDFDTCDSEIEVVNYEGPDDNQLGGQLGREELSVACGAGRVGVVAQNDPYNTMSFRGHRGSLNLYNGWSGTAVYERIQRNADADSGDAGGHGDAAQWGPWTGKTLNCNRDERLTISCNDVFPQYADATRFRPITATGMVMTRTNVVNNWADPNALTPGNPLPPSQGWALFQANCAWDELRTFNDCPASLSRPPNIQQINCTPGGVVVVQPGINKRRIQATATFGEVTIGEWVEDTPLQCRQVYNCTGTCSAIHNDENWDDLPDDEGEGEGEFSGLPGFEDEPSDDWDDFEIGSWGGTVLCTYFYNKGMLAPEIYAADMAYGRTRVSEDVINGYHAWAIPMVEKLQTGNHPVLEKVAHFFVKSWAEEMAYVMGESEKSNPVGRVMRLVGEPICALIGKLTGRHDYRKLWI